MSEIEQSPHKGVGYYNKDNRDNKYKKDKTLEVTDNVSLIQSLGIVADATQEREEVKRQGALSHLRQAGTPTPLDADQIRSCIFQLFDNGEASTQRYKYKLRLNLTDGTNPEFIASLTKDLRNFKKHIPEPNRQEIIDMAMSSRRRVKEVTGHWPWIGKLHLNQGQGTQRKTIQNEPDTLVVIWWDPEERSWAGMVKLQNWLHKFDLFDCYITQKQRLQGVRAQDNWQNPKYDKRQRPQTWAEKRSSE
jgi:hypothetical protein